MHTFLHTILHIARKTGNHAGSDSHHQLHEGKPRKRGFSFCLLRFFGFFAVCFSNWIRLESNGFRIGLHTKLHTDAH